MSRSLGVITVLCGGSAWTREPLAMVFYSILRSITVQIKEVFAGFGLKRLEVGMRVRVRAFSRPDVFRLFGGNTAQACRRSAEG